MADQHGTMSVFDTLGARRIAAGDLIGIYDPATIYEQVQVYLRAHNNLMNMMENDLFTSTTDRFYTWGNVNTVSMMRADEFSRPRASKMVVDPTEGGYPLEKYQAAYQVTQEFMDNKTMGDLDTLISGIANADVTNRLVTLRDVLFNPTNNTNYKDISTDSYTLKIRAFLNADSTYIPNNKYGVTFDPATHTHFLGTSSFAAADLLAQIKTVQEHYPELPPSIRVYANGAQEQTIRGFTGFYPYWDRRIDPGANTARAIGDLDLTNTVDRPIGVFDAAQIWIKPWMPAGYTFAFHPNAPKPLKRRVRPMAGGMRGDLRIVAQLPLYPLFAEMMEREEGFGVWERTNGCALKCDNATYSAPSAWSL
jgi:hypothetical protein